MTVIKNIKIRFIMTAAFFGISAVSVLLTPYSVMDNGNLRPAGYAAGILFWAGLILGAVTYLLLCREYKKMDIVEQMPENKLLRYVCSNPAAIAADVLLVTSLIMTVYASVNIRFNQTAAMVFLFLMVMSVYAHFLLNGKVFRYIYRNDIGKRKEGEMQ